MSMAVKYAMKKRMAKGGSVGKLRSEVGREEHERDEDGDLPEYRPGMHVKGVHKVGGLMKDENAKNIHEDLMGSMAIMGKHDRKYLAEGGDVHSDDCPGCEMCHGGKMADGGDVEPSASATPTPKEQAVAAFQKSFKNMFGAGTADAAESDEDHKAMGGEMHKYADDDMVGSIMKKRAHMYSKGGRVANDTGMGAAADLEDNQFDDLVKDDDLEFSYTGANSGDEIGNAEHDKEDHDMVSQIMKSRRKKDRLPNPR